MQRAKTRKAIIFSVTENDPRNFFMATLIPAVLFLSLATELLSLPETLAYTPYTVKLNSPPWDIIVSEFSHL